MVSKKDYFQRTPTRTFNLNSLLGTSRVAVVNPNNSTKTIENLGPNEVAVIPYTLVPFGFREGPDAHPTFPMFSKRGPRVKIPTESSLEDAMASGLGPTRRRIQTFDSLDDDIVAVGMSWYSPQDRQTRIVTPHSVLEGTRLYVFGLRSRHEGDKNKNHHIEVAEYGIDRDNIDSGASVMVHVPSRSQNMRHRVKLHNAPFIGSHDLAIWPNLLTAHSNCGSKDYDDVFWDRNEVTGRRKKQRAVVFDPHDVAAYFAFSHEETARINRKNPASGRKMVLQPFPLFTPRTVDFWKKLLTQTFFGQPYSAQPLRGREINTEMMRFLARNNASDTQYTQRGMRFENYDWTPNFPRPR